MTCEPACAYVTHYVPGHGHIHHALTCVNHPYVGSMPKPNVIPVEATTPVRFAVQARREAVAYWWNKGKTPRKIAAQFHCSLYTINDDLRYLRTKGLIGLRPRQLITRETLNAEQ